MRDYKLRNSIKKDHNSKKEDIDLGKAKLVLVLICFLGGTFLLILVSIVFMFFNYFINSNREEEKNKDKLIYVEFLEKYT